MELFLFNLTHKVLLLSSMLRDASVNAFKDAFITPAAQNMNSYVRLELLIIGCVFLMIPMAMDTPPHWLMLLPLISIYLINAAITGYEPLYATIKHFTQYASQHWTHNKPASQH